MTVTTDSEKHLVIIRSDLGTEITLSWASALNLGSLLIEKAEQAEPAPARGKRYQPATERARV
jgi:hypothetical protein